MIELTPEEIAECRRQAEIEVGLLVPELVQVPDGYYTRRVELDPDEIQASICTYDSTEPVAYVTATRIVPCRIPRYRTEIRYVPAERET